MSDVNTMAARGLYKLPQTGDRGALTARESSE
jgi:hypothetical protein